MRLIAEVLRRNITYNPPQVGKALTISAMDAPRVVHMDAPRIQHHTAYEDKFSTKIVMRS